MATKTEAASNIGSKIQVRAPPRRIGPAARIKASNPALMAEPAISAVNAGSRDDGESLSKNFSSRGSAPPRRRLDSDLCDTGVKKVVLALRFGHMAAAWAHSEKFQGMRHGGVTVGAFELPFHGFDGAAINGFNPPADAANQVMVMAMQMPFRLGFARGFVSQKLVVGLPVAPIVPQDQSLGLQHFHKTKYRGKITRQFFDSGVQISQRNGLFDSAPDFHQGQTVPRDSQTMVMEPPAGKDQPMGVHSLNSLKLLRPFRLSSLRARSLPRLLFLAMYGAAPQERIVFLPFQPFLLQFLILGGEITRSRPAFLGRLRAFQNHLITHGKGLLFR
jgi:hypothetical protein